MAELRTPSAKDVARLWAVVLRDPLTGYDTLRREYGDAVRLPYTRRRAFYLLSRPEYAEHVLVSHQDRYVKAFTYRPLRAFLGEGLLTSEGESWQRHRRLVQPVFSHRRIQAFAPQMVAAARARTAAWRPGATIDAACEMRTLTMDVVGRVLFGTDLAAAAEPTGSAVSKLQDAVMVAMLLPTGSAERTRSMATKLPGIGTAAQTLEDLVRGMTERRMAAPHETPTDLLDLIIAAGADQQPLSPAEIRDELMTLVLAGHETTANSLTWTLTLLSRFPAARERLAAEVDEVLAGRDAEASDVEKLVWTQAVLNEALRLYPPAWTIERDAVVSDDVAGVPVPAGCTVAISPYLIHRHPEFWSNPEGFDPERFLPQRSADRRKYAFVPFGGGRRICVGAGFAQLEAALALATIAQTRVLDLVPGTSLRPKAGVTMHPRGPVPMAVSSRR
jgi:cytochrome P450